jgi:hypothetical protein
VDAVQCFYGVVVPVDADDDGCYGTFRFVFHTHNIPPLLHGAITTREEITGVFDLHSVESVCSVIPVAPTKGNANNIPKGLTHHGYSGNRNRRFHR